MLDIIQIIEVRDVEAANKHLAQGWQILNVRIETVAANHQVTVYVLGLPKQTLQSASTSTEGGVSLAHPSYDNVPATTTTQIGQHQTTKAAKMVPNQKQALQTKKNTSEVPSPSPAIPRKVSARLRLPDDSKPQRKKDVPTVPVRELTEEEKRHQAAWQQVQETGKPVIFDDTILLPEGMAVWDAIEFLPEDVREATRHAWHAKTTTVFLQMVKNMRERISSMTLNHDEHKEFTSYGYLAQMAIAETLVREQLGMAEVPMRDLLQQHGAQVEDER